MPKKDQKLLHPKKSSPSSRSEIKKSAQKILQIKAVIESEERFRTLIEESADAIQLLTAEGQVLYSSNSLQYVAGYTPKEVVGDGLAQYIHPDDWERFGKSWQELLSKPLKQISIEYRIRHKDGSWIWLEATGTNHLATANINAIVGNFRNITERKIAEEGLKRSEERNQMLIEHSPMPIAIHMNGLLTYANEQAVNLMAAKNATELVGKPITQFVHPDSLKLVMERAKQLYSGERQFTDQVEEKLIRLDGEVIHVEITSMRFENEGKPAVQLMVRDITERKQAEVALQQSMEDFRSLANTIPQLVWATNPSGVYEFCNQRWYDYTATTSESMKNVDWMELIHPEDREHVDANWSHSLSSGQPYSLEYRLKNGQTNEWRWFLDRALPIRNSQGEIVRWFGTCTDIDEFKALQRQRDDFLSIASHELRTPLTSVKAYTQLLHQRFETQKDLKTSAVLARMNIQIDKLTTLVSDLLDVTKIESGQLKFRPTTFNFDALVTEMVDDLRLVTASHEFSVALASQKDVQADRDRVGQVITNLLANAIKYSPPATEIIVRSWREGQEVRLSIQDFGMGISKSKQSHVFERFYRAGGQKESTYSGLGLGLFISSEILQRLGGRVWVESQLRKGSTFHIALPLLDKK